MTPMQFVSCSDTTCPMNQDKQCRAPFITINQDGTCKIRDAGPYDGKAETEKYVEIKECQCSKCNHWEQNAATLIGACGLHSNLFFDRKKVQEDAYGKPVCDTFHKQITPPGFAASINANP